MKNQNDLILRIVFIVLAVGTIGYSFYSKPAPETLTPPKPVPTAPIRSLPEPNIVFTPTIAPGSQQPGQPGMPGMPGMPGGVPGGQPMMDESIPNTGPVDPGMEVVPAGVEPERF